MHALAEMGMGVREKVQTPGHDPPFHGNAINVRVCWRAASQGVLSRSRAPPPLSLVRLAGWRSMVEDNVNYPGRTSTAHPSPRASFSSFPSSTPISTPVDLPLPAADRSPAPFASLST